MGAMNTRWAMTPEEPKPTPPAFAFALSPARESSSAMPGTKVLAGVIGAMGTGANPKCCPGSHDKGGFPQSGHHNARRMAGALAASHQQNWPDSRKSGANAAARRVYDVTACWRRLLTALRSCKMRILPTKQPSRRILSINFSATACCSTDASPFTEHAVAPVVGVTPIEGHSFPSVRDLQLE